MGKGKQLHWEPLGSVPVGDQYAQSVRHSRPDRLAFYALGPVRELPAPPYEELGRLLWAAEWQLDLDLVGYDGAIHMESHCLGVFPSEALAKADALAYELDESRRTRMGVFVRNVRRLKRWLT